MSTIYMIEERCSSSPEWELAPDVEPFTSETEAEICIQSYVSEAETVGYAARWVAYTRGAEGPVRASRKLEDDEDD